jgi:hypothetical protein
MIGRRLLIAALLPMTLSAQNIRAGRTPLRANNVHVDTRASAHQRPAAADTLEEHPTVTRTGEALAPAQHKAPPRIGNEYTPAALQPAAASTDTLNLEGSASWSVTSGTLNIKVAKINHNGGGTTGSLRLRLWATHSAYQGGSINGYVLGTSQFQSTLGPYQYFHDVSAYMPFTAPPDGTYSITLTLEEYTGSGWFIVSYVGFSDYHFGAGGGPASSSLNIQGNESWSIDSNVLTIKVDKIVNDGGGMTGTLRLQLWATNTVYGGGTIRGYVLGGFQFTNQLGAHQYFSGIDHKVQFNRPPDGTYYTTLTLEEYTSSGWVIRDYADFNSTTTFGAPDNNPADPCAYRTLDTSGLAVTGVLTRGSCLSGGYRIDGYKFYAVAGSPIQIVMQSPDFYTYQALFGSSGDLVASAGEGWNDGQTVITITAPVTGEYYLLATSNDPSTGGPGALGNYTLSARVY